ncbi:MAG: O-antigen ligase family protein [Candidatus Verstraetearchaeota archaeon]|nr:O-antigen ligase family protein [Candidatus Verstraetearchaeota archaeon]
MKNRRLLRYMLALYIASAVLISYMPWGADISQGIGIILAFVFTAEFLVRQRRLSLPRELILFSLFFVYTLAGGFIAYDYEVFVLSEFTLFQLLMLTVISYNIMLYQSAITLAMKSFVAAAAVAGILAVAGVNFSNSGRLTSTLGNPNIYGLTLLFAITMSIYLYIQSSSKREKLLYTLFIPFSVYQIILTGSRKAIIGLFSFVVIAFALYVRSRSRYRPGRVFLSILILGGMLVGSGYMLVHSKFYKRLEYLEKVLATRDIEAGGGSIKERIEFYIAAYATWRDHPLFGVGTNQFRFYTSDYVPGLRSTYAHSNFMEILADFGIVGFILYYSIYIAIFHDFYKLKKIKLYNKDQLSVYVLLALIVVYVISELAWVSYSEKITWIVLSIIIAQIRNMYRKYRMSG